MAEHPHQTHGGECVGEQEHRHERHRAHAQQFNRLGQGQEATQGQESHETSTTHKKRRGGSRHAAAQSPQLGDVLTVGGGNHTANAHRQQRLGHGMGEQQQQGQNRDLQRNGDEDKAHVGRCGIRQRAFDVHLSQGHQRATDRTDAADHEHHADGDGRELKDGHHLQQHDGAAGHHHRVPQNRSGVRALHGFVQPEVHGELGAFARWASDQAQTQQRCRQRREGVLSGPGVKVVEPHHAGIAAERHHTHQQQHITNALGEEGIPGCCDHQGLGIPETHQ